MMSGTKLETINYHYQIKYVMKEEITQIEHCFFIDNVC